MTEQSRLDADLNGPISPPRDNGEIVFGAPWERRVFGLTMALCRSDACEWKAFRQHLIRRIADDEARPYWRSWPQRSRTFSSTPPRYCPPISTLVTADCCSARPDTTTVIRTRSLVD